jgi:hypothetical protein
MSRDRARASSRFRKGACALSRLRKFGVLLLSAALVAAGALAFLQSNCPAEGGALSAQTRAFVRLKNRTHRPRPEDFEARVTLDALLLPGDDRARWSEARAAAVEGYVVGVETGGIEAANCYSLTRRDTHVYLARRPDAPTREAVVAEVTPRLREWAAREGDDWSEESLRRRLMGRRCRVEGWLLYDTEHDGEAENTAPGRAPNWRATAWEIHPVTRVEVLE